jgi:uncharacterized protein YkwD
MKKPSLIAALILLTSQIVFAQDGPTQIPSPEEPQRTTAASYEEQVLEIVNQERWTNGQLPPLKGNSLLDNAAETHSTNMAVRNFFDHCDLDTKDLPWDRMLDAGYSYNSAGENIAIGQQTPVSVMNSWMGSSGHRTNILSTSFREIGIGYYYQSDDQKNVRDDTNGDCNADTIYEYAYYRYWTQNFGRRNNVYPVVINREAYETETRQVNLYMYGQGWATEMRFRNENGTWSGWETYQPNKAWTLSAGNGIKTVNAEIRNGSGTVRSASDTIILNGIGPSLSVTPGEMGFALQHDGPLTQTLTLTIQNTGQEPFSWSLDENADWLFTSSAGGSLSAESITAIDITVSRNGQSLGVHHTTLTIDAGDADNSPQMVDVSFLITDQPPVFLPAILK